VRVWIASVSTLHGYFDDRLWRGRGEPGLFSARGESMMIWHYSDNCKDGVLEDCQDSSKTKKSSLWPQRSLTLAPNHNMQMQSAADTWLIETKNAFYLITLVPVTLCFCLDSFATFSQNIRITKIMNQKC